MRYSGIITLAFFVVGIGLAGSLRAEENPVSFSRDIAPILRQRCIACHSEEGPKSRYRVDTFAGLKTAGRSGAAPFVEGQPDASLLIELISSADEDDRMPQDDDALSKEQVATMRRWVLEGAVFDGSSETAALSSSAKTRQHPKAPARYRVPVPVLAVALSPSGEELATGAFHEVLVWNVDRAKLLRRIGGLPERVTSISFLADGKLIIGGGAPGDYGQVFLADANAKSPPRLLHSTDDIVSSVAIDPAEKLVAVGSAGRQVALLRRNDHSLLWKAKMHSEAVTGVAFRRDGKLIASSSKDMTVKTYSVENGSLFATHRGHNRNIGRHKGHHRVFNVVFDPDGSRALSAGEGPDIQIWDPEVIKKEDGTAADLEERFSKETTIQRITHGYKKSVLALLARAGRVFSASGDGIVREHELATGKLLHEYTGQRDHVLALDYHKKSKTLVSACFDGRICIWVEGKDPVRSFVAAPGWCEE